MGNCPLSPHRPPLHTKNIKDLRNQDHLDHHLPSRTKSKSGEAAASIVGRVDHSMLLGHKHVRGISTMAMLETKAMLYLGEIICNRKCGGEGEDNRDGDWSSQ